MTPWLLPIRILVYILALLAIMASFSWNGTDPLSWLTSLRNFFLIFASGWLVTYILQKIDLATWSRAEHRIITALILFLLFDPLFSWWIFILLGVTTELLQRLLRVPGGPVFNPAALTAFVMSFFGFFPSWWGTNFSPRLPLIEEGISIAVLITLPLASYVVYKYKKHWISIAAVLAFTLVYVILLKESPLFIVLDGTLIFFLLVMAVEPKTTPILQKEQVIFGIIVGSLISIGIYFHWLEAYTMALLIGNLYTRRTFLRNLFTPHSTQPSEG